MYIHEVCLLEPTFCVHCTSLELLGIYACESGKVIWIINDFLPPLVCMCAGNVLQRALVYDDVL